MFDYNDVSEVCEAIDGFKVVEKYSDYSRKKIERFNKIVGFTYTDMMNFKKTSNLKGAIFSANFLSNVNCLVHAKNVIHHSQITGDIIGYAHSFCNLKVRENKNQIIANIANQIKFIDTCKYYQQTLSVLTSTMTDEEGLNLKKECKKFIESNSKLNFKFQKCSDVDQEWILNYLSSGKGVIPYKMITRFDFLDMAPENGVFF